MKNVLKSATKPLKKLSKTRLKQEARAMFAVSGLARSKDGWLAPIDFGLKGEPALALDFLQLKVQQLTPRWADVYFQELPQRIAALSQLKSRFVEINNRYTNAVIAQQEMNESEKIHADEVTHGWYGLQEAVSNQEYLGQRQWAAAAKAINAIYNAAIGNGSGNWINDPDQLARMKAWINTVSLYSTYLSIHIPNSPTKSSKDFLWARDPMQNPGVPVLTGPPPSGSVNDWKSVPGLCYTYSQWFAQLEYTGNQTALLTQKAMADGSEKSAANAEQAKKLIHDWNVLDVDFRRRRSELSVAIKDLRNAALTGPGGPFNDTQNLVSLRMQFVSSLGDLLTKAIACTNGLGSLWQWERMPAPPMAAGWNDSGGSYLDALINWFSGIELNVAANIAKEGTGVATISLAGIAPGAWGAAIAAAGNGQPFTLDFVAAKTLFLGRRGVRLRGLSAYVKGVDDEASGAWRGSVRLPVNALSLAAGGTEVPVSQPLPAVDIGRAFTRGNVKPADIIGTSQLRNASPISNPPAGADGSWRVALDPVSSEGTSVAQLRDLSFDVFYSYAT